MPKTMRVIVEVDLEDHDGPIPHPKTWDWEELVGGCRYIGEAP